MARISFSDAEQMAMQANLQANLSRINRKKGAEAEAEKTASAAEENKEINSPSPATAAATEEKTAEAVIVAEGAAAADESDEERQAREQREIAESYKKARVRCGLETPPPSASTAQPQHQASPSAPTATVVPSAEAEEKKKVVSAAVSSECTDIAATPFFRAPFEALEAEIGSAEKIVFLYLYANAKERVANASLREISIKTHMAKTTVKKALGVLRDCAWIGWDKMTEESGKIAKNNYSILKWANSDRSENDLSTLWHYPYARAAQPQEPKAASLAVTELMGKIEAHLNPEGDRSENGLGQNLTYPPKTTMKKARRALVSATFQGV